MVTTQRKLQCKLRKHSLISFTIIINHSQICKHFTAMCQGGGRSTVSSINKGRAVGETPTAVLRNAAEMAPDSYFPNSGTSLVNFTDSSLSAVGESALCPLCMEVLDKPLELPCDMMVCLKCLTKWIQLSGKLTCPCCFDHPLNSDHLKSPSNITMSILGSMQVVCDVCTKSVQAKNYTKHLATMCSAYIDSPSKATIRDILSQPSHVAPSPTERRVAGSLIKRMMAKNEGVVQVPTSNRGQVLLLVL